MLISGWTNLKDGTGKTEVQTSTIYSGDLKFEAFKIRTFEEWISNGPVF